MPQTIVGIIVIERITVLQIIVVAVLIETIGLLLHNDALSIDALLITGALIA
jgi:hypothetical protein